MDIKLVPYKDSISVTLKLDKEQLNALLTAIIFNSSGIKTVKSAKDALNKILKGDENERV